MAAGKISPKIENPALNIDETRIKNGDCSADASPLCTTDPIKNIVDPKTKTNRTAKTINIVTNMDIL
jgi:hypothetical protein